MKRITSTDIQRNFKELIPIPEEGYEISRDGVIIGMMLPADVGINVAYGIEIDVREESTYLGRCNECGYIDRIEKIGDRWLCKRCEKGREKKKTILGDGIF
jgi:hypothetical protein